MMPQLMASSRDDFELQQPLIAVLDNGGDATRPRDALSGVPVCCPMTHYLRDTQKLFQ